MGSDLDQIFNRIQTNEKRIGKLETGLKSHVDVAEVKDSHNVEGRDDIKSDVEKLDARLEKWENKFVDKDSLDYLSTKEKANNALTKKGLALVITVIGAILTLLKVFKIL